MEPPVGAILGAMVAPFGLLGVWMALGDEILSWRLGLSILLLSGTLAANNYYDEELAWIAGTMILVQWAGVQVSLWPLRLIGGWRLTRVASLACQAPCRRPWRLLGKLVDGVAASVILFASVFWLLQATPAIGGTDMLVGLAITSGVNVVVGWLAMRVGLAQRAVLAWLAITVAGAGIVTMVELHTFAFLSGGRQPEHKGAIWALNAVHLGVVLVGWLAMRLCGFRLRRGRQRDRLGAGHGAIGHRSQSTATGN